jgi:hypothetical protein
MLTLDPSSETHRGTTERILAGEKSCLARASSAASKRHIRKFLEEALEELGFTTCKYTQVGELSAVHDGTMDRRPTAGVPPITP